MNIKSILSFFFVKTFGFHLFRWFNKNRLIILCYHRVTKRGDEADVSIPGNCVDEDKFDEQMNFIKNFYNPISQEQLVNYFNEKELLPKYPVLVTIDDGYKDNFTNAHIILKKYQIPTIIFITTGYINGQVLPGDDYIVHAVKKTNLPKIILPESKILYLRTEYEKMKSVKILWNMWNNLLKKRDIEGQEKYLRNLINIFKVDFASIDNLFMSWEEIKKLNTDGISFGCHTLKHKILTLLSEREILTEIREARQEIEKYLDRSIVSFAYPNGKKTDYDQKCINILKENGFSFAVTTELGTNNLKKNINQFELKRICISYKDNLNMLKTKISFWISIPYLQNLLS